MRKLIAMGAIFGTAACIHAPRTTVLPSNHWLIGAWAAEGESCDSDAGIVFRSDRTWIGQGASGTWRIERDAVITIQTKQWVDGEPPMQLAEPERSVQRIEIVEPDAFVSRWEDGSTLHMDRCPE